MHCWDLWRRRPAGSPLGQQFQERLFGPVGLGQTSLPAIDDTSIPAPYSHGYMYGGTVDAPPATTRIPLRCRPKNGPET